MKLTKAAIDKLTFEGASPKAKDIRWDDEVKGFGLRLWLSGARTFVFKYRVAGRQRMMTIGDYGTLTPDQARKIAMQKRAEVLGGTDPLGERQKVAKGETLAELAKVYIERHSKVRNKTWAKDEKRFGLWILPAFGTAKAAGIKRRDVAQLHHKIGKTSPYEANRVLALLSSFFNRLHKWGLLDEGHVNPAKGIDRYPEEKRERFVSRDEMPRLLAAIDQEDNIYARGLIWLYLLTGLRREELLALRWADVDLERGELALEDTKAGRSHLLPLSAPALAILAQLPRIRGNQHIFPGQRAGTHLVDAKGPWKRVRERAGLDDVRLHDLRRTVGSWAAQAGASLPLIGRILNHSNPTTTQVYARFSLAPVAKALEDHAGQILDARPQLGPPVPPDLAAASSDVD